MSGNQESCEPTKLTIDDKLQRIKNYLDNYEKECGFPETFNVNTINRATDLMNIDFGNFRMTSEECHESALILATYANNLQRVINREKATILFSKEEIKKILVPHLKRQAAYNYEERVAAAISENAEAIRLNKHKIDAELRLTHIESMYFSVKNLSDKLSSLGTSLGRSKF